VTDFFVCCESLPVKRQRCLTRDLDDEHYNNAMKGTTDIFIAIGVIMMYFRRKNKKYFEN